MFTNWLRMPCHAAKMPQGKQTEHVSTSAPKSLSQWMKLLRRLWLGDKRPSRFETRLERLSRHREESAAETKVRMIKNTATARWWRRFR